jgi:hypothetical protein
VKPLHEETIAPIKDLNLQNLLKKLLDPDPLQRLTAQEALGHVYFADDLQQNNE